MKSILNLAEIIRLYEQEKLSLARIAEKFGLTKQAVHQRLVKAGVKMRPAGEPVNFDRETIVRLYVDERKNIGETAKILGVGFVTLSSAMERLGIEKRPAGQSLIKHFELYNVDVGESVVIKMPVARKVYPILYSRAKRIGIKISIKSLSPDEIQVTRIG